MLRPDYALQMWVRTLPPTNPQDNPEYQILCAAIQELKRLYKMELFAAPLVQKLEEVEDLPPVVETDAMMVKDAIAEGKQSWLREDW